MANRPFHEVAELIRSRVGQVLDVQLHPPKSDAVESSTNNLLNAIGNYLIDANPRTPEEIKDFADELRSGKAVDKRSRSQFWPKYLMEVNSSYTAAYDAYFKIKDVENSAHRSERRSQIRAVFFRIVTTLGVGLSIMFIYWLADYWGLSMPLSRKM